LPFFSGFFRFFFGGRRFADEAERESLFGGEHAELLAVVQRREQRDGAFRQLRRCLAELFGELGGRDRERGGGFAGGGGDEWFAGEGGAEDFLKTFLIARREQRFGERYGVRCFADQLAQQFAERQRFETFVDRFFGRSAERFFDGFFERFRRSRFVRARGCCVGGFQLFFEVHREAGSAREFFHQFGVGGELFDRMQHRAR
jgi:hypothetical protein